MPNRVTELDVHTVSLVNRAAVRDPQNKSEPRRLLLWKREGVTPPTGGDHMTPTLEELQEQLAKAQSDLAERDKTIEKLQAKPPRKADGDSDDETEGDETTKSEIDKSELAPEVRAALEKAEQAEKNAREEAKKAQKTADEALEKAEKETNVRVEREFVTKAETDYSHLSADPSELGPVLKRASEALSKEDFEAIDSVLKGADEAVRQGDLFKQAGRDGQPPRESNALGQLEKHAAELRKSDLGLTPEDALAKACEEHPDLQRQYTAEMRGE